MSRQDLEGLILRYGGEISHSTEPLGNMHLIADRGILHPPVDFASTNICDRSRKSGQPQKNWKIRHN